MTLRVEFDEKHRSDDGLALITVAGPQLKSIELDLPFKDLYRSLGSPHAIALDLLVVAGVCYAIDKAVSRKLAQDAWTRTLEVSIPVSDPKRWETVAPRLNTALTFLSGDVWHLSFRESPCQLFAAPKMRSKKTPAPDEPDAFDAVSLFSGGLDSLIGAVDFLAEDPKGRLLLVGHYDAAGPRSQQKNLYESVKVKSPAGLSLSRSVCHKGPLETQNQRSDRVPSFFLRWVSTPLLKWERKYQCSPLKMA